MKRSFQIKMPKVETFDKQFVLQQASEVFHTKGYHATSMQDLVEATGLNRSSIYNSFGCKLNLFMDVLAHYQDKNKMIFQSKIKNCKSAEETLKNIFTLHLQQIQNDTNNRGCMLVNGQSEMANQEPSVKSFMQKNQDSYISLFTDLVQQGQQEGYFNTIQTPKEYATFLYSSIQGLRMMGILDKDIKNLQPLVDTILRTLN